MIALNSPSSMLFLGYKKTVGTVGTENPLQNVDGCQGAFPNAAKVAQSPVHLPTRNQGGVQNGLKKISAKKRSESVKVTWFSFCCTLDLYYIYMYTVHHLIFKHG